MADLRDQDGLRKIHVPDPHYWSASGPHKVVSIHIDHETGAIADLLIQDENGAQKWVSPAECHALGLLGIGPRSDATPKTDLHTLVELTDRQYREVVAYCSGVVDVDTVTDGEWRSDPRSVMAVLLRHLRNMLVDPVGARSLKREVRIVRDADGAPIGLKYLPIDLDGTAW